MTGCACLIPLMLCAVTPQEELSHHLSLLGDRAPACRFAFSCPKGERTEPFTSRAKVVDGTVHFWGDDRGTGRQARHGTLFAVYGFLEEVCGIRWVAPGERGIVCPAGGRRTVPPDWSYRFRPPLGLTLVRDYGAGRILAGNPYAPEALRLSDAEAERIAEDRAVWALRMRHQTTRFFKYGHAFRDWQKRYLADHPEFFGLNPYGTRGLPDKQASLVKLCLSNEAVVDEIVANWERAGKGKYLNVCPNDGTPGYCFCENCRKLDADLPGERFHAHKTDRYVNFWNRVVAKARAKRPDVTVIAYIYSYYRFPPRRERIAWPDNMLFGFVPSMNDDYRAFLREWNAAGMKHFFLRPNYMCFRGCVTRGLERWLYDNFHDCLKAGATGVDYDGRLGRPSQALEYYVVARMAAFPGKGFDEICDEFYSQYGAAASAARAYFERVRTRGERFLAANAERMRRAKLDVLDDGELSAFAVNGHTERDLEEDLRVLRGASADGLSAAERARFDELVLRAEQNLLVCRFFAAGGKDDATLERAARELDGFRRRNRSAVMDEFGNVIRATELDLWRRVGFYREEVLKDGSNPADPAAGWRSSFDRPGLDGWIARDAFVEITDRTASFDKYSAKFRTSAGERLLGLWRKRVPVTPGAEYRLSFDVKLDEGVDSAGLRAVESDSRKEIVRRVVPRENAYWRSGSAAFGVPAGCEAVDLYFHVGTGGEGRCAYLDNIVLERQKKEER